MSRSYVAIYQNKESNYFLYFDFKKHEFFSVAERQNQSKILLISFVSIVFYALMKNVSFGMAINPLKILLIVSILGIMLGYISIKLTNRGIEKGLEHRKEVVHPTNQELREYLFEGKKQFNVLVFIILFLFLCVFLSAVFLYFMPQSVLMFLVNIGFWAISILVTWLIRPIKRSQAHKQLEEKLEKHSG
ncbi:hypothetical protein [Oceanobacillus sp. J11TS1]|uniref:hypothetical protein n=1 Tax=Oceanobacillus sp. J11TS1 TaxID=2807191 RepID=UPI001B043E3C|nr:hypothetical protein [Oceanobacillus sp. J11TS1]GIO23671.1 hypothetical protein J11TS1_22520 [Oceanobacillus sp. J11TS1]